MAQYLSIVLRSQFNLFYRFGYSFIQKSELIEFNGNITDKTKNDIIQKFATTTPFEYDEEYLILHLELNERFDTQENVKAKFYISAKLPDKRKNYKFIKRAKITSKYESSGGEVKIDIRNIVKIYPLSQQAKVSIESKIDQRIRLERPIFESILPAIEAEMQKQEVLRAISALWEICGIENSLEKYLADIKLDILFNGLEYRKNGTQANKIQDGGYWEYLIAYDRFDYFPNTVLGYFYDAGQVFAYSKNRPTFEGSSIHALLEMLNHKESTLKFKEIVNELEKEEMSKGYISQTTTDEIKQYIIAPLYLMLRDEIRKSEDVAQTKLFKNLEYLKEFGDSFCYVVVLLGAFFGFRKFYDIYYENLNLRFYKNYNEIEIGVEKEKIKEQEKVKENNNIVDCEEEKMLPIEPPIEERVNNIDLKQKDEQLRVDTLSQYHIIISDALKKQSPIKLTDLAKLIKIQTGKKFDNRAIKGILKDMSEINMTRINKAEAVEQNKQTLI